MGHLYYVLIYEIIIYICFFEIVSQNIVKNWYLSIYLYMYMSVW